jgi:hypothetical protein
VILREVDSPEMPVEDGIGLFSLFSMSGDDRRVFKSREADRGF